jgi:ABC-type histidine transport system ATPase subunit
MQGDAAGVLKGILKCIIVMERAQAGKLCIRPQTVGRYSEDKGCLQNSDDSSVEVCTRFKSMWTQKRSSAV